MSDNIFVYKKIKSGSNSLLNDELTVSNLKESFEALLNKLRLIRAPFSYELFTKVGQKVGQKFKDFFNK